MTKMDLEYYLGRVEAEKAAARAASSTHAARVHDQLADEYVSLILVAGSGVPAELHRA